MKEQVKNKQLSFFPSVCCNNYFLKILLVCYPYKVQFENVHVCASLLAIVTVHFFS